ncbi:MAG: tryptophan--tRNA ligase [Pseudomonadota bacterium]
MQPFGQNNKRVFSGIQPSGDLHLGNYLGAIRNWVHLQARADYDCIFCIVDLHAITVFQDPKALRQAIREVAATIIAAGISEGIDTNRHILFVQSANPDHAYLGWIFNCVARIGWLNRMTQFKDKAGKNREASSTGLYIYPNLMAADILAYQATHVPVGEDQKQHLELARDIAIKFNNEWAETDFFPMIQPMILKTGARVMSLRDGTRKMSKSDPSDFSRINLLDDPDTIRAKIRKARTDSNRLPDHEDGLEGRPEARNLVEIYAHLNNWTIERALESAYKDFADFKTQLSELLINRLRDIRTETQKLLQDPAELDRILDRGAERAIQLSQPTVDKVADMVGLRGRLRR